MSIWHSDITLDDINQRNSNTLSDFLGIIYSELGDDYLVATMPVKDRVKQPLGIMHGGASCVLAESVGSNAANYAVNFDTHYCVGLDINTNHIRAAREGLLTATAKPFHIGRSTQVWSINIENDAGKIISVNRLTMAVMSRE